MFVYRRCHPGWPRLLYYLWLTLLSLCLGPRGQIVLPTPPPVLLIIPINLFFILRVSYWCCCSAWSTTPPSFIVIWAIRANLLQLHSSEPLEALFPVISPGVDSPLMAFIMMRTGDNYTGQWCGGVHVRPLGRWEDTDPHSRARRSPRCSGSEVTLANMRSIHLVLTMVVLGCTTGPSSAGKYGFQLVRTSRPSLFLRSANCQAAWIEFTVSGWTSLDGGDVPEITQAYLKNVMYVWPLWVPSL